MEHFDNDWELDEMLEAFLKVKRTSEDTGYPEVTTNDLVQLGSITYKIIELKFAKDVDGDLPISFSLVDRTQGYRPYFQQITYPSRNSRKYFEDCVFNLGIATEEMEKAIRYRMEEDRYRKDSR